MRRAPLLRLFTLTLPACSLLALPAPAHAEAPGLPSMSIYFKTTAARLPYEHTWCASGRVDPGPAHLWTVVVRAWRSDGSTYQPAPATSGAATLLEQCVTFPKLGKNSGGVSVTVTYAGASEAPLSAPAMSVWSGAEDHYKDWAN